MVRSQVAASRGCYLPRSLSGVTTFAVNIGIWLMAAPEFDKGTLTRTLIGAMRAGHRPTRSAASLRASPLVKFLHPQRCHAYGQRGTTATSLEMVYEMATSQPISI
jgi:hypothetical protein